MEIPVKKLSQEDMLQRVARYKELQYPADRYPDSQISGNERKNYLVIGTGLVVDGGKDPMSAIPINEGFTMSYVKAKPGNGPVLHNHDTNETFVAITGKWRVIWGGEESSVDLDPMDVCSVPPFVPRRFINLQPAEGDEEGLLLAIQAGDHPKAEWLDKDDKGNLMTKTEF